jgi:hypothetical protein
VTGSFQFACRDWKLEGFANRSAAGSVQSACRDRLGIVEERKKEIKLQCCYENRFPFDPSTTSSMSGKVKVSAKILEIEGVKTGWFGGLLNSEP